jgi:hypothetical protein
MRRGYTTHADRLWVVLRLKVTGEHDRERNHEESSFPQPPANCTGPHLSQRVGGATNEHGAAEWELTGSGRQTDRGGLLIVG